jgi:hypothetical protein
MVGIEPTTYGLRNRCSTAELHWLLTLRTSVNNPQYQAVRSFRDL